MKDPYVQLVWDTCSTASVIFDRRQSIEAYQEAVERAELRRTIDMLSGHSACSYCGGTAHRPHQFREREVCCGCGAFWGD